MSGVEYSLTLVCASIVRKEINLNVNKILFLDQSAVTMAHEHVQEPDIGAQEIVTKENVKHDLNGDLSWSV